MAYEIHFGNISVEVGDCEPFIVLQDKYGHLTGRCRSTDIGISVKDILVGDNVAIAGSQGLVTKIEKAG